MLLVDSSIWINVFRDKTGEYGRQFHNWLSGEDFCLTRFQQLELLQGCRSEQEWALLASYLEDQDYLETKPSTWQAAARIYYDLRRLGLTVRSPIDCCIAQIALENRTVLVHNDADFETIAQVRPLAHSRYHGTS